MERELPTASDVSPVLTDLNGGMPATDAPRFTRAQAPALRRSAPQMRSRPREHFALLPAPDAQQVSGAQEHAELMADCIHTVYRTATGNWANEAGSGMRVYGVHATKQESVRRARELARAAHCPHVIHNEDGTISSFDALDG